MGCAGRRPASASFIPALPPGASKPAAPSRPASPFSGAAELRLLFALLLLPVTVR